MGTCGVAEGDEMPKRISVWTLDGQLVKALYGPCQYGAGGSVDPRDPTRFYYWGMEFKLDWEKATTDVAAIYFRDATNPLQTPRPQAWASGAPETAIYVQGRQYMTDAYAKNPTNGNALITLWLMEKGLVRPVAAAGLANSWSLLKTEAFRSRLPAGSDPAELFKKNSIFVIWSDRNGNGKVDPEECVFQKLNPSSVSMTIMRDLSLVSANLDGRAVQFSPVGFADAGVPLYDIDRGQVLATGTRSPITSGGGQALAGRDGWTILTVPPEPYPVQASMAGVRNGQPMWSYPSLWPGLHPSQLAPLPDHPGQLIGTTRLMGPSITPKGSDIGEIWAINGNKGNAYLFSTDGLFVATLFKDCRTSGWGNNQAFKPGMLISDWSMAEECFFPTITQTDDGRIYIQGGGSLVSVEGLEQVCRLPTTKLMVTPPMLQAAQAEQAHREIAAVHDRGRMRLSVVVRSSAPALDGKLTDWPEDSFVKIDDVASAAVAVSGERLYAAFRTRNSALLQNKGDSRQLLFKTGGALDLMVGADPSADPKRDQPVGGDSRLLVALVDGKTVATLYQPVAPGMAGKEAVFTSPGRTARFDRVEDVSDQVVLAAAPDGSYELSVPLALIGVAPKAGRTILGDIGVLRGNGFQTLQRVYWSNKATGLTSDIPGEAALTPGMWGQWQFQTSP